MNIYETIKSMTIDEQVKVAECIPTSVMFAELQTRMNKMERQITEINQIFNKFKGEM